VRHFGPVLGPSCWVEFTRKRLSGERLTEVNARIAERWSMIQAEIGKIALPAEQLAKVLRRAGAPTTPAEIGWSEDFYASAVLHAREIRNRYTFLDLAADSGVLEDRLAALI
jgi:glycerol-1-phosphate dehydrogenase [NAD(P)+]